MSERWGGGGAFAIGGENFNRREEKRGKLYYKESRKFFSRGARDSAEKVMPLEGTNLKRKDEEKGYSIDNGGLNNIFRTKGNSSLFGGRFF